MDDLSARDLFDVILLRNVMIYFDATTRAGLVGRLQRMLTPGGHLLVGHAESLNGLPTHLRPVRPSIYRLPSPHE